MPDSRPWYAELYESDYRQFWSVWPDDPERDARQVRRYSTCAAARADIVLNWLGADTR